MTSASDHGSKHTCASCNIRFYDLHKSPAVCPKCNHQVVPAIKAPARRKRLSPAESTLEERNAAQHALVVAAPKSKGVKWKTGFSK